VEKRAIKGVKRSFGQENIRHKDFQDCLKLEKKTNSSFYCIRHTKQKLQTIPITKVALSPFDDKRYLTAKGTTFWRRGTGGLDLEQRRTKNIDAFENDRVNSNTRDRFVEQFKFFYRFWTIDNVYISIVIDSIVCKCHSLLIKCVNVLFVCFVRTRSHHWHDRTAGGAGLFLPSLEQRKNENYVSISLFNNNSTRLNIRQ